MTVKQRTWRFASLFLVLIAGTSSAAQAGVIPWAYNAIFGPASYPAYGYGYGTSYGYRAPRYVVSYAPAYSYAPVSYGYAPVSYGSSGCSSCSANYVTPASYAPTYGDCGNCGAVARAASCGSCDDSCPTAPATSRPAGSKSNTNGFHPTHRHATPKDATKTYANPERNNETDDGLETGVRSRGLRTDEEKGTSTETFKPVPGEDESIIPKVKKKAPAIDRFKDEFETPVDSNKEGNGEAKLRWPQLKLNLDDKIAWRNEAPRTRVPFHAKVATVRVARHVPSGNSDWTPVVAKPKSLQLVKK